jgi:GNAT superfamily N-acetyltransferase
MIWYVPLVGGDGVITIREQLEPDDEPAVLELFTACSDWFEAATGLPSGPGDVQGLFYALPDGATWDDKRLFVILAEDRLIGLVDVVLRYPDVRSCALGLFLVHPDDRRRGVGTAVARELLGQARTLGFDRVTEPVAAGLEPGDAFARSLGFTISTEAITPAANRIVHRDERPIQRATLQLHQ